MITYAVVNEDLAMEASMDYIIVLEDEYKSGRDCSACDGKGHLNIECSECHGRGTYRGKPFDIEPGYCTTCTVGQGPLRKTLKFMPCHICNGTGTSSIVIPDDAQVRPTTGVVQSLGPLCGYIRTGGEWVKIPTECQLKNGDRVLYHQHTGKIFELGAQGKVKIRYIKEGEILGRLHGVVKRTPTQGEFGELKEVGIAI
jgi:co-chaperonin GroES (HSP10)